jgi:hypothetical protein
LKLWNWKIFHRGPFEWHLLPTKSHENLPFGSKLHFGAHRQTDW